AAGSANVMLAPDLKMIFFATKIGKACNLAPSTTYSSTVTLGKNASNSAKRFFDSTASRVRCANDEPGSTRKSNKIATALSKCNIQHTPSQFIFIQCLLAYIKTHEIEIPLLFALVRSVMDGVRLSAISALLHWCRSSA